MYAQNHEVLRHHQLSDRRNRSEQAAERWSLLRAVAERRQQRRSRKPPGAAGQRRAAVAQLPA